MNVRCGIGMPISFPDCGERRGARALEALLRRHASVRPLPPTLVPEGAAQPFLLEIVANQAVIAAKRTPAKSALTDHRPPPNIGQMFPSRLLVTLRRRAPPAASQEVVVLVYVQPVISTRLVETGDYQSVHEYLASSALASGRGFDGGTCPEVVE
jgi:hypothetical protein